MNRLSEEELKVIKMREHWQTIHEYALSANSFQDRKGFEYYITNLSKRFFCEICQPHFVKYLEDNPISKSPHPFEWSFRFHNAVNRRLGKREITLREALNTLYKNRECESCKIKK